MHTYIYMDSQNYGLSTVVFFSSPLLLFFLIGNGPNCAYICIWRSIHLSKLKLQNEADFLYLDSKAV